MRRVGSREFKNRLGRYLAAVRKGHSLIITDRGKAVPRISPEPDARPNSDPVLERLKELEAQGLIHLATKPFGKFHAVKSKGKPASQMLLEDRR
jgi:antitoxin (DNA-binding transcriptional repressor) of toxin-antitoxin stability system